MSASSILGRRAGWGPAIFVAIGAICATSCSVIAQQPKPASMSLETAAAKRFPQPVRVEALLGRTVLEPKESQPILGHVRQIVRNHDRSIKIIVDYGGFLGFGTRPIAVPVEAMVLLGQYMEIVDFTPAQLDRFPTVRDGGTPISGSETIHVGLARPSH